MPIISYRYSISETGVRLPDGDLPVRAHIEITKLLGVGEWLCLRYCDGCELFITSDRPREESKILRILKDAGALPGNLAFEYRMLTGKEAVGRILQIAAGAAGSLCGKKLLEILQTAYIKAVENDHLGPYLHRLFQKGIWVHEKARQETDFFQFAVEPQTVFRELAGKIFGSLAQSGVCIIGAHPMMTFFLEELHQAGSRNFVFFADESEAESSLIRQLDGTRYSTKSLTESDVDGDIVLIFPVTKNVDMDGFLRKLIHARNNAPLLALDYSDSKLNHQKYKKISNLYLYEHHDLEKIIQFHESEREAAAKEIGCWIEKEVAAFFDWHASEDRFQFAGIIGSTPQMQRIFELVARISRSDITVLIEGESGTGKELVAKAIHNMSARSDRPFRVVNCGAIPDNLLESELFGHVKGAFTGAIAPKQGLFEVADKGTIFLDEIAELPQHLQVKLLRFLQEGEIKRVGSNETIRVDVRVLAASNQDLLKMVEAGEFRSDLYYRLNVIQLTVPPLRERPGDIPLLVKHFIKKYAARLKKEVSGISPDALRAIRTYTWPGNVRELENAIERSTALAIGKTILLYDMPPVLQNHRATDSINNTQPHLPLTLKEVEKEHILETLKACDWNYEAASKQLGIGRTTLWRKLREYGVEEKP